MPAEHHNGNNKQELQRRVEVQHSQEETSRRAQVGDDIQRIAMEQAMELEFIDWQSCWNDLYNESAHFQLRDSIADEVASLEE